MPGGHAWDSGSAALKVCLTGAAGFIGSHLTDRLLDVGWQVTGLDNFSTGQRAFLRGALAHPAFTLVTGDVLDDHALNAAMRNADIVFHLAANADVRHGPAHPGRDLEQNTIATHRVLEAMRRHGVGRLAFVSSGAVYGDAAVVPTPEDTPFPVQTSFYGASKLAAEALITAHAEAFGIRAWIFRCVSMLGPRYTHGHVFDFTRQLRADPSRLAVLGDGRQRKSCLHVADAVAAMLHAVEAAEARVSILNLGTEATVTVDESVAIITGRLGLAPRIEHGGGDRGWVGDSPLILLDTRRIRALGWAARHDIPSSLRDTVDWLVANPWVFETRR